MEKLEPILKQKFWILLGIAIIMTFTGWWIDTGRMKAAIASRTSEIDKSFGSVPSGEIPNEKWIKRLSAINVDQEKSIKSTQLELWKRQLAKMNWPEGIEPVNGYWGKFPNEMRDQFRDSYPYEIKRLWKLLNPLDEESGDGIVKYPMTALYKVINKGPWPVALPESDVMWEAREDIWLLEALFQSIAEFNGGYEAGRGDASIHQIDKLELRGGGEKKGAGGGAGATETTMGTMGSMGSMGAPTGFGGSGPSQPGGGAAATGSSLTAVSAEFDPTEEFGDDGSGTSTGAGGGGNYGGAMMAMAMGGGETTTTTAPTTKTVTRYISDDKSKPFKTRGFYLSVKMDHSKIPAFIEALTSNDKSVWPVEIIRVQMSRINEDDATIGGGMGGGMGPGRMMPRGYAPGMSSLQGAASTAASSLPGALGSGRDDESLADFGVNTRTLGSGEFGTSEKAQAAKVAFDNALKDPNMAQVTICGIFTLYNKVEEVIDQTPPATSNEQPSTEEAKPEGDKSGAGENKTDATTENSAESANGTTEPAQPTAPAEPSEAPAEKSDARAAPKPDEPRPEPKPDGSGK